MDFSSSYKKKGLGLDPKEKRILRVRRRSVDQRVQRDETYMRQRDIESLTPLKENTDENVQKNLSHPTRTKRAKALPQKKTEKPTAAVQPPAKDETAGTLARRKMLEKWKQEKELKKKLAMEMEKQKPRFKVFKVGEEKRPSYRSEPKPPGPQKPQKNVAPPQRRVTRASTKASTSKPVNTRPKPAASIPVVPATRVTRQSSRLASNCPDQKENRSTRASEKVVPAKPTNKKTKKSSASKTEPSPEAQPVKIPSPSATHHVTSERGASSQIPLLQESFAPLQFTFNFQFPPMSPASTQTFLFPGTAVRKGRCSTPMSASRRRRGAMSPQQLEISAIQSPKKPVHQSPPPESNKEDVSYFRNLLTTHTAKLNALCSKWENVQQQDIGLDEEISGEIRCTIGKAQLLIAQRFKQFSGLVDNCEFGLGDKKTHCSDLNGFWDMIHFQVEDVLGKFQSLDELQANNWLREIKEPAKPKKIIKKAKLTGKSQPVKDREAARQRLAAIKAAMKAKKTRAKAAEQKDPFTRYLQPTMPSVVNLNEQAEDLMQIEPQQQQVELGVGSQPATSDLEVIPETVSLDLDAGKSEDVANVVELAPLIPATNTPRTRSRCKSGLLLPGLSPHLVTTPSAFNGMGSSNVFTPPPMLTAPLVVDDLICFDSPVPASSVEAPSRGSVNQPNLNPAQLLDSSCDNMAPSVRRSMRLRHHSAFSSLTAGCLSDSEVPEGLYKPNVSGM